MKSAKLNKAIHELEDKNNDSLIYESCIGGKLIPYIGWFWRDVSFDDEDCYLGILPEFKGSIESNDSPKVGFMENNKWGYDGFIVKGDEWKRLRSLIELAVKTESKDDFAEVDKFMQSLLPENFRNGPKKWVAEY